MQPFDTQIDWAGYAWFDFVLWTHGSSIYDNQKLRGLVSHVANLVKIAAKNLRWDVAFASSKQMLNYSFSWLEK